jgi:hypothetical protein
MPRSELGPSNENPADGGGGFTVNEAAGIRQNLRILNGAAIGFVALFGSAFLWADGKFDAAAQRDREITKGLEDVRVEAARQSAGIALVLDRLDTPSRAAEVPRQPEGARK